MKMETLVWLIGLASLAVCLVLTIPVKPSSLYHECLIAHLLGVKDFRAIKYTRVMVRKPFMNRSIRNATNTSNECLALKSSHMHKM
ncbi:hypothetical protein Lalb_Chr07g0183701 [Lupinus albus]|uniref:Uncharacterized protein n=1 Tax=Lupinus albus TaxID=3870 RepID=A0A6A4Q8C3_LUPAL|nr:hypothetical protein Lalb_Chr07g0183701 [Lupinus albus]